MAQTSDGGPTIEVVETPGRRGGDPGAPGPAAAGRPAGAAAQGDGPLSGHADAAGGRAAALDQARQRRALGRADAGPGRLARPAGRASPGPTSSTTSGSRGSSRGCSRSRTGRSASWSRERSGCGLGDYVTEEPYLVARMEPLPDVVEPTPELEALTRNVQRTFTEIIEQIPYLPEELQLAVTNVDDPSALAHLIAGALRISTEEKQELLEEVDVGRRLRRLSEILARELEVIQLGSKIQSQVQSEIEKGQREYYLREQLKAIQQELGEADEQQAEINELRERIEAANLPEDARKQAERELGRLERLPPRGRRVRRHPHLPRVAGRAAVERDHRGRPRHRSRARGPRRRSLRPREGQGPDPRVPGGAQADAAGRRLDGADGGAAARRQGPILCFVGPPGVGKTSLGRSISRALGAQVRAHLGRRGARRGGDPRPPAHLHRGDAGNDRPRPARRRLAQPRVHDRRDRQDGRRLSRRPVQRHARGSRPGAERQLPRPLPGPRVRPLRGDVHHHGEHARHGAAARSPTGWR